LFKGTEGNTRNFSQDVPKETGNGHFWNTSQSIPSPNYAISSLRNFGINVFKHVRKCKIIYLKDEPNFSLLDVKRNERMVTEEYCWTIT
jgi:hypothetical protein